MVCNLLSTETYVCIKKDMRIPPQIEILRDLQRVIESYNAKNGM